MHLIETPLLQSCFEFMFHKKICTPNIRFAIGSRFRFSVYVVISSSLFFRHIFRSEGNSIWKTNRFQWKVQFLSSHFCLLAHPFVHLPSEFKRFVYVLDSNIYVICSLCTVCEKVCVYRYSRVQIAVMVGWLTGAFFLFFLLFWHHH